MYYFMVLIVIFYFFAQNIKMLYDRFTGTEPAVAATWILLALTVLYIPLMVLMFFKAKREYKAQKAQKEEEKQEMQRRESTRRREMYFDDFEGGPDGAQALNDADSPDGGAADGIDGEKKTGGAQIEAAAGDGADAEGKSEDGDPDGEKESSGGADVGTFGDETDAEGKSGDRVADAAPPRPADADEQSLSPYDC